MHRIDDFLIERVFSPLAGWVAYRLGMDQWRLSIEALNGTIAFHLGAVALTIGGKGLYDGIFADMLAALAWLGVMALIRRVAYRQASSSLGRQSARLGEGFFRLILVAILPLSLYYAHELDNLCHTLSLICFLGHLYFKACDSPPPRSSPRLAFVRG
jgi:hypothetical protein